MNVGAKQIAFLFLQLTVLFQTSNALILPAKSSQPLPLSLANQPSSQAEEIPSRELHLLPQNGPKAQSNGRIKISPESLNFSSITKDFFSKQASENSKNENPIPLENFDNNKQRFLELRLQNLAHQDPKVPEQPSNELVAQPDTRKLDDVPLDINFETQEIKDAVAFIEFKMNEINALMKECIDQKFDVLGLADIRDVKNECVGISYQILFFNYHEGIRKIKGIFLELLKIKLEVLKEDYEDETNFFLDVLEDLVDKDYQIVKSMDVCKKAAKYYVSPRYFERIMDIAQPEIDAFMDIHNRLRAARHSIQEILDDKQKEADELLQKIEQTAQAVEDKRAAASQTVDAQGYEIGRKKNKVKKHRKLRKENKKSTENYENDAKFSQDSPNLDSSFMDKPNSYLQGPASGPSFQPSNGPSFQPSNGLSFQPSAGSSFQPSAGMMMGSPANSPSFVDYGDMQSPNFEKSLL